MTAAAAAAPVGAAAAPLSPVCAGSVGLKADARHSRHKQCAADVEQHCRQRSLPHQREPPSTGQMHHKQVPQGRKQQSGRSDRHRIAFSRSGTLLPLVALLLLLLLSASAADAAMSQCKTKTPVCPSRSEALSRKPTFDTETLQHIDLGPAAAAATSSSSMKSMHKASTATSSEKTAAVQQEAGHSSSTRAPQMSWEAAAYMMDHGATSSSRKERLFVQPYGGPAGGDAGAGGSGSSSSSRGSAFDMPPQRVTPTANLPQLSQAAQQAMFTQLANVLQQDAAAPPYDSPADVPQAASSSSQRPVGDQKVLFLNNARLRVGLDTTRGGALSYLSSPVMPPEWANVNLINTWDSGRLIQQSYYGCYDDSCWVDRPWRWNPVQGGSWQNGPPKLLASSMGAASVTTAAVPRNWGGQQLLDDVLMVTETELHPNVVKVRFTMRYTGSAEHPKTHQEVPAVFVNRRLNVLAMYTGDKPWSDGQLTFIMPGQVGEYYQPTERWAAYVDMASGFGVGVYSPVSSQLVAYRIGPENSTARSDVSYMAPLVTANIQPNTEFSYDAYIAVGRVDEMRSWFADIARRVQPTNEAGTYKRPIPPALSQRPIADESRDTPSGEEEASAEGRPSSAARSMPRVSLLVEPKVPAVKLSPGGSDAVAFATALPTPEDLNIDSLVAAPAPTGLKLSPKPQKKAQGKPQQQSQNKPSSPQSASGTAPKEKHALLESGVASANKATAAAQLTAALPAAKAAAAALQGAAAVVGGAAPAPAPTPASAAPAQVAQVKSAAVDPHLRLPAEDRVYVLPSPSAARAARAARAAAAAAASAHASRSARPAIAPHTMTAPVAQPTTAAAAGAPLTTPVPSSQPAQQQTVVEPQAQAVTANPAAPSTAAAEGMSELPAGPASSGAQQAFPQPAKVTTPPAQAAAVGKQDTAVARREADPSRAADEPEGVMRGLSRVDPAAEEAEPPARPQLAGQLAMLAQLHQQRGDSQDDDHHKTQKVTRSSQSKQRQQRRKHKHSANASEDDDDDVSDHGDDDHHQHHHGQVAVARQAASRRRAEADAEARSSRVHAPRRRSKEQDDDSTEDEVLLVVKQKAAAPANTKKARRSAAAAAASEAEPVLSAGGTTPEDEEAAADMLKLTASQLQRLRKAVSMYEDVQRKAVVASATGSKRDSLQHQHQKEKLQHDLEAMQAQASRLAQKEENRGKKAASAGKQGRDGVGVAAAAASKAQKRSSSWRQWQALLGTVFAALQAPSNEEPALPDCRQQRGSMAQICI